MTLSPLRSKKGFQNSRSLSLPSKFQHPSISKFNYNLAKIAIENPINGLKSLYNNIDDLLLSPHIQHVISREKHEKWVVDRVVDAYIRLLDACTTAKDAVSQTKHDVQHLLSALRRKDAKFIQTYHEVSTRNSKKMIQKALKELRRLKSTKHNDLSLEKDQETMAVVYMIKEAEFVTITMFKNLLAHVIGNNVQPKQSGWSMVSKLMMLSNKESDQSEKIDSSKLKGMESNIRIIEEELESLFRQLIKTRVFLLNMLNH
ncbi:hypothetical protein CASFOL_041935 [Castilleja foliolosa]|uniref:Uncharacterized protein n=1 Tax=Castilleja foliolosa TaxID=1961234 RepID=A0ABD3B9X1_9LAMI